MHTYRVKNSLNQNHGRFESLAMRKFVMRKSSGRTLSSYKGCLECVGALMNLRAGVSYKPPSLKSPPSKTSKLK